MTSEKMGDQTKELESNSKENANQLAKLERLKDEHAKCFKTRVILGSGEG